MPTKRVKKVIVAGVTREQMEAAFGDYATADASIVKITATMDAEFTKIRERNADRLATLAAHREKAYEIVQVYATENRDTLFAKRKSSENAHGVFGFRTGTPKLKTKKGLTWGGVLELLKIHAPQFVRTIEEVAKDKLLADREAEEVALLMPKIGVEVAREETFFIELKKEETETSRLNTL